MFRPLNALRQFSQYNPHLLREIVAKDDLLNFQSLWTQKIFEKRKVLEAVKREDDCDLILASWTHDYPDWLDAILRTNHILKFLKEELQG